MKYIELYQSLLIRTASVQKGRLGPSILLGAGGSLWAGFPSTFNSILFHEGGLQVLITPSPLFPPGITLGQRGERSTSSKWRERGGAHCRPGVRDTRVPRALKASRSRFSNCQFHCQADCMRDRRKTISVMVIIQDISDVRRLSRIKTW